MSRAKTIFSGMFALIGLLIHLLPSTNADSTFEQSVAVRGILTFGNKRAAGLHVKVCLSNLLITYNGSFTII